MDAADCVIADVTAADRLEVRCKREGQKKLFAEACKTGFRVTFIASVNGVFCLTQISRWCRLHRSHGDVRAAVVVETSRNANVHHAVAFFSVDRLRQVVGCAIHAGGLGDCIFRAALPLGFGFRLLLQLMVEECAGGDE